MSTPKEFLYLTLCEPDPDSMADYCIICNEIDPPMYIDERDGQPVCQSCAADGSYLSCCADNGVYYNYRGEPTS